MIEHEQDKANVFRIGSPADQNEKLPYCIELWVVDRSSVERVLALAFNATVARAIFTASQNEYPNRRITLRRGARVIADSRE